MKSSDPAIVRLTIRLPREKRQALRALALRKEKSVQALVVQMIDSLLGTDHIS